MSDSEPGRGADGTASLDDEPTHPDSEAPSSHPDSEPPSAPDALDLLLREVARLPEPRRPPPTQRAETGEQPDRPSRQGQVVSSRYRVEGLLGEGAMGEVWRAVDLRTAEPVALKFMKTGAKVAEQHRRFLREARAASAVVHRNVVRVHEIVEIDDEHPVLVMELLVGETLAEKLAREGKIPPHEVARIFLGVVAGVGAAHALAIVHRDLKPANIFLTDVGRDEPLVKVLDFGLAKLTSLVGTIWNTATGTIVGTPPYMSPEQAFAEKDLDDRTDIWSLGVILYECLSGELPSRGREFGRVLRTLLTGRFRPLREVVPEVPEELAGLVQRQLSFERKDRPTLVEMHAVLDPLAKSPRA